MAALLELNIVLFNVSGKKSNRHQSDDNSSSVVGTLSYFEESEACHSVQHVDVRSNSTDSNDPDFYERIMNPEDSEEESQDGPDVKGSEFQPGYSSDYDSEEDDQEREGGNPTRLEVIKNILMNALRDDPLNLFVLCQDNINNDKHKILRMQMGQGLDVSSSETAVYYKSTENLEVHFVDAECLKKAEREMEFTDVDPFLQLGVRSRLTACVITPQGNAASKVLLVSWHGPHKTKIKPNSGATAQEEASTGAVQEQTSSLKVKRKCFYQLVLFLEKLKAVQSCQIVLVGGDFNWPAEEAVTEVTKLEQDGVNGAVKAAKTKTNRNVTQNRKKRRNIDYVVYWPKDRFEQIIDKVVFDCRDENSDMFDHPIVRYQVKIKVT